MLFPLSFVVYFNFHSLSVTITKKSSLPSSKVYDDFPHNSKSMNAEQIVHVANLDPHSDPTKLLQVYADIYSDLAKFLISSTST